MQVGSSFFQETHHHEAGTEDEPGIRVPWMSNNGVGGSSSVVLVQQQETHYHEGETKVIL